MKKQLILLASFFATTFAMAQSTTTFGVRAGVTSANLKGDAIGNLNNLFDFTNGMVKTGSRTGFFAGGYASVPLSEVVSVEPGLYYAQKGTALKANLALKAIDFLGAGAHARLTENYIELPVLLKANFNGFQVFAGPQVSYLASAGVKATAGVLGINLLNKTMDLTDQLNRWDASVTGGVGYQFANGFNISAAYDHGLSRIYANKSLNTYNRSVKVGVGFRF